MCFFFFFLENINQCDHKSAVDSVILCLRLATEHNKGALVTLLSRRLSLLLYGLSCAFKQPHVVALHSQGQSRCCPSSYARRLRR